MLVASSIVFAAGGVVLHRGQRVLSGLDTPAPVQKAPLLAAPAPAAPPTTAAPPAPLPLPTLGLPAQPDRPIDIPKNSYARESVVEVGTIDIPKIGLSHRVFHGVTLNNIDHGPSHWPGTAWPGQPGNTVFAGHRVTRTHPFRHLDRLTVGDQVIFTVGGVRSVYAVTGSEIVSPDAVHIATPTSTPTGTLYACHPPGSARYRYVVHLAMVASPS